MKRILTLTLALLLILIMLTACGIGGSNSKSDDSNTSKDSNPPKSTEGGGKDSTGEIRTPDITVKPGDLVFSNEYMYLKYERVNEELLFVYCKAKQKSTEGFYACLDAEPLVINGIATNYKDLGSFVFRPLKEVENVGSRDFAINYGDNQVSALEQVGISPDEFESLQVTITIKDYDVIEVLFEITVLFIIEHN